MVVALSLKEPPSSDALPGDAPRQIGLMSLKQISDVLLVHDDRVLLQQQLTVGLGYVKMVGTVVKTADGKTVGKVMLASHQHHRKLFLQQSQLHFLTNILLPNLLWMNKSRREAMHCICT